MLTRNKTHTHTHIYIIKKKKKKGREKTPSFEMRTVAQEDVRRWR